VVYAGPPRSGKVESVQALYTALPPDSKGKMITVTHPSRGAEATLFFDFVPPDVGTIRGVKIRLHLYVLSGGQETEEDVRLVLENVDGVVFVATSRREGSAAALALET
jgi:hypothetical protein